MKTSKNAKFNLKMLTNSAQAEFNRLIQISYLT